jgi:hypothetical protein
MFHCLLRLKLDYNKYVGYYQEEPLLLYGFLKIILYVDLACILLHPQYVYNHFRVTF